MDIDHLNPLRRAGQRPMAYWFTIMILVVVATLAFGHLFYYYGDLRRQNEANIEASLNTVRRYGVEVFEIPILLNDTAALESKARAFLEEPFITRVQIYNGKGEVLKTISRPFADDIPTTIERVEVLRESVVDTSSPGRLGAEVAEKKTRIGAIEFHVSRSVFTENQNKMVARLLAISLTTIFIAVLAMLAPLFKLRRSVATVLSGLDSLQARNYDNPIDQRCEISEFQPIVDKTNELASSIASHEQQVRSSLDQLQAANTELTSSEQRTREAEESLRRFIRIGSHELRNPVNGLVGLIELLSDDLKQRHLMDDKLVERCDTSLRLLDEMQSTLERLFDLSRMSNSAEQLKIEAFLFNDLVKYIRMAHTDAATAKRIAFSVRVENEIPELLLGDLFKLRHLLGNIVQNAIKFTKSGFVEVVFFKTTVSASRIMLCCNVIDTGSGIDSKDMPHIFREFFTRTPGIEKFGHTYSGWGLGLAFVKRMVDLMGGTSNVRSELGKGTIFSIEIPLEIQVLIAEGPSEGSAIDVPEQLSALRILVVDDEEVNAQTLAERLNNQGALVDTCLNAMVAKANVVQGRKYDMAIIDYRMPGYVNGAILAEELRKLDPDLYIVGLTGDMSEEVRNAWESIVDRIVFKPVNAKQLQNIVHAYHTSKATRLWPVPNTPIQ
jgi:signal transduction histidine kinase/ActR/RegA family two-component response regulator